MTAPAAVHPSPARTGVWVGIAAICMSFAAFTSALVVREGPTGGDWQYFRVPPILFVNTGLLLLSSVALEVARRRLPAGRSARGWLALAGLLGLAFVTGQVLAWRGLAAQGVFLAGNPSAAFFYVLTVVHALHVLGGLAGLSYAYARVSRVGGAAGGTLAAAGLYWHFMGALWLYVLLILVVRI